MRALYMVCGFISLVLGIIGIVLPVLPTTPFVLLAALCFAKSSQRFYEMLLNNRFFGCIISEWESKRCIRRAVRYMAFGSVVFTFSLSIIFFIDNENIRIVLVGIALILLYFLWRVPLCEDINTLPDTSNKSD
ncbi:YbaN family protein [Gammaproteobacteria bacterium AH-315-C21]|nr:YbaN family protein [Gammaproteobacteria bacterium AH-315-C21]